MRDWSLPGYKYLGPGNPLNKGRPRNRNDAIAQLHDIAYQKIQEEGGNPYIQWSDADETARKDFSFEDYGGALGKTFFQFKKLAWQAGLINKHGKRGGETLDPDDSRKRLRFVAPTKSEGVRRAIKFGGSLPEAGTVSNSQPTATSDSSMPNDGGGSGTDVGLKETPVDDPYVVHRGPPDYTFASLPYMETYNRAWVNMWGIDHAFRMTSVYDPVIDNTVLNLNGVGGNVLVSTPRSPDPDTNRISSVRWYDYYATMYKYYHVLSCRYKIYIENMSNEPLWAHMMFYNDVLPPQLATNEDIMMWTGVRTQYLSPHAAAVTTDGLITSGFINDLPNGDPNSRNDEDDNGTAASNTYASSNMINYNNGKHSCVFAGEYRPGQFKREIINDAQVENWTTVNTNPLLSERLLIRLKPENPALNTASTTNTSGDSIKYKFNVSLEYLVEFKELDANLRWPVQRQPLTILINSSANTATA